MRSTNKSEDTRRNKSRTKIFYQIGVEKELLRKNSNHEWLNRERQCSVKGSTQG